MLPASVDVRTDPTFREFLHTMRERCVSNATLLRIFTPLVSRDRSQGFLLDSVLLGPRPMPFQEAEPARLGTGRGLSC